MPTITPDPDWQSDLLKDEQGHVLCWEFNANLIIQHDPLIREQVRRASKEVERVTLEVMLFLQSRYQMRLSYQMLSLMVKLISEGHAKAARRAALTDDTSYFSPR